MSLDSLMIVMALRTDGNLLKVIRTVFSFADANRDSATRRLVQAAL